MRVKTWSWGDMCAPTVNSCRCVTEKKTNIVKQSPINLNRYIFEKRSSANFFFAWYWTNHFISIFWSVVDLQCCVNFCYTAKWFGYIYIYIYIYIGEGNGTPLQYSCLENPMNRGRAWRTTVHGVTNSRTRLGDYHLLTYIHIHVYRYIYIYVYVYPFWNILFHSGLLQDIDYASLCYTTGPCHVSTLYTVVCSR